MPVLERVIGVHENASPDVTNISFPGACWGREFVSAAGDSLPLTTTGAALCAKVLNKVRPWTTAGLGCIVSVKLDMAEVATGAWDSRLAELAHTLTGLRVKLIIRPDPESDTEASVFVAGNNRSYGVLKRAAPSLEVATCAMTYAWRPHAPETADPAVWADAVADIYLSDVYFGNSYPLGTLRDGHPGWTRWYEEIVAGRDRRWGLAEYGVLNVPGRPGTIDQQAEWFATDPIGQTCETIIVWDTGGAEANPLWLLDAPAQAAVARMVARLRPSAAPTGLLRQRGLPTG